MLTFAGEIILYKGFNLGLHRAFLGKLWKILTSGLDPERFWFNWSEVEPGHWGFFVYLQSIRSLKFFLLIDLIIFMGAWYPPAG